jgi:hypothetical protein
MESRIDPHIRDSAMEKIMEHVPNHETAEGDPEKNQGSDVDWGEGALPNLLETGFDTMHASGKSRLSVALYKISRP